MRSPFPRALFASFLGSWLLAAPAAAQTPPAPSAPSTVRTVLASTGLPSVVDAPPHFKLLRVSLPAGQATTYGGPAGFVFLLSGALSVTGDGASHSLRDGDAVLVPAGKSVSLRATGSGAATFLHFLLLRADELAGAVEGPPATVIELYRTAAPIPGLRPGPYEFSLVRVTLPPRFPFNPPHRRSGAALYYVLSGTGAFATGGKKESRPAGSPHYEPYDLIHQWANVGDTPLVLLQANISQEGVPAVIFEPGAPSVR